MWSEETPAAKPFTPAGYVDNDVHNFGSILNFIESNFNLGSLGAGDAYSDNLSGFFQNNAPQARRFRFVEPRGTFDVNDRGDPDDY